MSLSYSSSGYESNWSTFGIVRPNDFGILSPSWEFSIKIGITLSIQKKEKIVKKKKNEWVGICYVKLITIVSFGYQCKVMMRVQDCCWRKKCASILVLGWFLIKHSLNFLNTLH